MLEDHAHFVSTVQGNIAFIFSSKPLISFNITHLVSVLIASFEYLKHELVYSKYISFQQPIF